MMVHPVKMQWYLTFPYKLHINLKLQWISNLSLYKGAHKSKNASAVHGNS